MVDPQHGAARINLATFFSGLYVRARGKIHDLVIGAESGEPRKVRAARSLRNQRRADQIDLRSARRFDPSVPPLAGSLVCRSSSRRGSRPREASGRSSLIEALDLVPDFLEDLVSKDLLDSLP